MDKTNKEMWSEAVTKPCGGVKSHTCLCSED